MKVVLVTCYYNHHQAPLAEEFYNILGDDFTFVATERMPEWRIRMGYFIDDDKKYVIKSFSSKKYENLAKNKIDEADVVIFGDAPQDLIIDRLRRGKLTFRCNERWFKDKPWYCTGPRGWVNLFKYHIRFIHKPVYMLAASAFTANDVYSIGVYKNKVYKWGYFTKVGNFDIEASLDVARRGQATILWCARFIPLKHPELPVQLAKKLKDNGYSFHIDMIGSGEKYDDTVALSKSLGVDDVISFLGNMSNDDVLKQMRLHRIFLFTSDKNEGWGAVLNEAMSNGCAVVSSDIIGAAPFLINHGQNGLIYKSGSIESLFLRTKELLDHPDITRIIEKRAYETMRDLWNPNEAANRFIKLSESLLRGVDTNYYDGPCSKAYPCK